jgi:DNA-binding GntR family transcriptional regulator
MLLSELAFDRVRSVVDAARGSLDRTRLFLLRTPQRQHQSYVEHVAIAGALKAGDPDAAQRAMAEHLDRVLGEIELRAAQNPQAFAPSARS